MNIKDLKLTEAQKEKIKVLKELKIRVTNEIITEISKRTREIDIDNYAHDIIFK